MPHYYLRPFSFACSCDMKSPPLAAEALFFFLPVPVPLAAGFGAAAPATVFLRAFGFAVFVADFFSFVLLKP